MILSNNAINSPDSEIRGAFYNYTVWSISDHPAHEKLICWQAPSLAALGWIPFADEAGQLPEGFFQDQWPGTLAIRELLKSGNDVPQDAFSGAADFAQSLDSRDFRSALVIDQPKLYCSPDGTPRRFTCWRGHRVGFTPMRMLPGPPHPGEGAEYKDLQTVGQQVTFDFWMRFKLGRLADWAGMLMTRHRAPSAAIRIRLTMRSSGSAHVTFISSDIPSQRFYIDWKVNQEYSMTDCDERQFRGFIEAGKCKDAPVASRFDARLETKAIA